MVLHDKEKLCIYTRIKHAKVKGGPVGRLQIQAEAQWCPDSENKQAIPSSTGDWAEPGSEETF